MIPVRKRTVILGSAAALVVMVAVAATWIIEKERATRNDPLVALACEWTDVRRVHWEEDAPISRILEELRRLPVAVIMVSPDIGHEEERLLRGAGFSLMWGIDAGTRLWMPSLLARISAGDGIASLDKIAPGYPDFALAVARTIREKKGFYPLVEFVEAKGTSLQARSVGWRLIKTHYLPAEEMIAWSPDVWGNRLLRAVRERGVRLLAVRFSQARDLEPNLKFLRQTVGALNASGFTVSPEVETDQQFQRISAWHAFSSRLPNSLRSLLLFFLALMFPVLGFVAGQGLGVRLPIARFLLWSAVTLAGGLIVHGLGSTPEYYFGLEGVRGVKLLLVGPLGMMVFLLLSREDRKRIGERPITSHHLFVGGVLLIVVLGLYLLRSGNYPVLGASDFERHLRDAMEHFFGARPRFKEFLIGHPLAMLGFYIQTQRSSGQNFLTDGRAWILAGSIGQISILNTFLHFHSPVTLGLLRTIHGLWLGILLATLLCYAHGRWVFPRSAIDEN